MKEPIVQPKPAMIGSTPSIPSIGAVMLGRSNHRHGTGPLDKADKRGQE